MTNYSQLEKAIVFSFSCSKMVYASTSVEITMGEKHNDLTEIIAQTLNEMKKEQGDKFDLDKINLAELERRTGITRAKLRRLKSTGFVDQPHALTGRKADNTLLTGFTGIIDTLLLKGITNSAVCYDRIKENGFQGGLTIVKDYITSHKELVPPKRQLVTPQGSRGQRYQTAPGESYQMDWGFVEVETPSGGTFKVALHRGGNSARRQDIRQRPGGIQRRRGGQRRHRGGLKRRSGRSPCRGRDGRERDRKSVV